MSGFAGVLSFRQHEVDIERLNSLAQHMNRIGPDKAGVFSAGPIGLCHALLRTTPESETETQPYTLDRRIWVVGDVRIDDRKNLITKLISRNQMAAMSTPDIELVLLSWYAWGQDLVDHIIGDFAFAIWDAETGTLICARDHMGVIPLYYAKANHELTFSNTLSCLHLGHRLPKKFDERAIVDYLVFGFNTDVSGTVFQQISQLPPAHMMIVDNGSLSVRKFWQLPCEEILRYRRPTEYLEHFTELFETAVGDRLRSNTVSVTMSGGMDSTSIAAVANHLMARSDGGGNLRAFTTSAKNISALDFEHHFSSLVAQYLDIPQNILIAHPQDILKPAQYNGWPPPAPEMTQSAACQRDLYQSLSDHGRVSLTGHGGDPIFLPNPDYLMDVLTKGEWLTFLREFFGTYSLTRHRPTIGIRGKLSQRYKNKKAHLSDTLIPTWLKPELSKRYDLEERVYSLYIPSESSLKHATRHQAYFDLSSQIWPSTFADCHSGFTGLPLEIRHPFMDIRLIKWALKLPPIPWCQNKYLLRRAMTGRLPDTIVNRSKAGLLFDPFLEAIQVLGDNSWQPTRDMLTPLNNYIELDEYYKMAASPRRLLSTESHILTAPISVSKWMMTL